MKQRGETYMKHEKINGKLLNLEKKWHHLSCQQRQWIIDQFRAAYVAFLNENSRHPNKEECNSILDLVYTKIQKREIWIPYVEVKKAFSAKLQRYRKIEIDAKESNNDC
jgi:hypothetical protein